MYREAYALFVISGLIFLAACGHKSGPTDGSSKSLRITRGGYEPFDRLLLAQIADYEQIHPDKSISYEPVPGEEYYIKLQTAIAAGNEPDICYIAGQWVPKFAREQLVDIPPDAIQESIRCEYVSTAVEYCSYDGIVYGFPYEGGSRVVLYNKKLVAQAGIEKEPETWEELALAAQRCTKFDRFGRMTQEGWAIYGPGLQADFVCAIAAFIWSNGGEFMNEEETEFLLDDPRCVEALQFFVDLIYKYKCSSMGFLSKPEAFAAGRAAYQIGGPWDVCQLKTIAPDIEIGAFLIPPKEKGGPRCVDNAPWIWAVSANSTHKAEAWKFIQYIQSTSAQLGLAKKLGVTPFGLEALKDPLFTTDPVQVVFAESNRYIRMRPRKWFFEIARMLGNQLEMALLGMKSPAQAMRDATNDIQRQMRIRQESQ
ncbi:MAG: sugar ABC transporter substrate-binding protein [bacterium]